MVIVVYEKLIFVFNIPVKDLNIRRKINFNIIPFFYLERLCCVKISKKLKKQLQ